MRVVRTTKGGTPGEGSRPSSYGKCRASRTGLLRACTRPVRARTRGPGPVSRPASAHCEADAVAVALDDAEVPGLPDVDADGEPVADPDGEVAGVADAVGAAGMSLGPHLEK